MRTCVHNGFIDWENLCQLNENFIDSENIERYWSIENFSFFAFAIEDFFFFLSTVFYQSLIYVWSAGEKYAFKESHSFLTGPELDPLLSQR